MSLTIQTKITTPQNNMTFRANGTRIRTAFNNAKDDVSFHSKQKFLERIRTRLKNYINKFKETFGINKCKNQAEKLSKEELGTLSKEADPYDFLSKEEQAIFDGIGEKAFDKWTQEEKNVFYKYDSLLKEFLGLETLNKEKVQDYKNVLGMK